MIVEEVIELRMEVVETVTRAETITMKVIEVIDEAMRAEATEMEIREIVEEVIKKETNVMEMRLVVDVLCVCVVLVTRKKPKVQNATEA